MSSIAHPSKHRSPYLSRLSGAIDGVARALAAPALRRGASDVQHTGSGDELTIEAFEKEALPHLHELFRTARRITGGHSDAQDLIQETYLQAWKSYHRFERGTNCRAWLYKILFNKIHHYHRSRYSSKLVADAEEFLTEVAAYEPPVAQQVHDEDILAALDRIPADYREVILLADVQEFAYREIAEILGIPIGTVMSRLSRGRKLLRIELADVARSFGIRNMKEGG